MCVYIKEKTYVGETNRQLAKVPNTLIKRKFRTREEKRKNLKGKKQSAQHLDYLDPPHQKMLHNVNSYQTIPEVVTRVSRSHDL